MVSTAGRKVKPLPPSLTQALELLGYKLIATGRGGGPLYRHPGHPGLFFSGKVPDTRGHAGEIICEFHGPEGRAAMKPIEDVITALRAQVRALE